MVLAFAQLGAGCSTLLVWAASSMTMPISLIVRASARDGRQTEIETVQAAEGEMNSRTKLSRVKYHRLWRGTSLKPTEDEPIVLTKKVD